MIFSMDYNVNICVDDELLKLFNYYSNTETIVNFKISSNLQIRYVIVNGIKMEFNYLNRIKFTIDHCILRLCIDSDEDVDGHTVILPELYSNIEVCLNYCNNLIINISQKY